MAVTSASAAALSASVTLPSASATQSSASVTQLTASAAASACQTDGRTNGRGVLRGGSIFLLLAVKEE
jgi:hypothetical protein